jgi:tetratricopeptide (TPR) repeat protein
MKTKGILNMAANRRIVWGGLVVALITQSSLLAQIPSDVIWSDPSSADSDESTVSFGQHHSASQVAPIPSIVTLQELKHRVPGRAAKEFERAVKAKEKGETEKAIAYFKNAIAADPEFCAAMNDLGTTYLRLNRPDLAAEQFEQAIAVDPHNAAPYSNLSLAYLRQYAYADAERTARRALELDRGSSRSLVVLGVSLILQSKFTVEAERSLSRAAADFVPAKLWLALWLVGKGEIATARDQLRTYVAERENPGIRIATDWLQRLEAAGPWP